MKKILLFVVAAIVVVFGATAASADSHEAAKDRYVELWYCKVHEGKSMDDVEAANAKWVVYVNESVEGGGIYSYILTPVVGKRGGFMYADSFPSIGSWNATREALESDEGKAIEKELEEAAECSSNSLHQATQS